MKTKAELIAALDAQSGEISRARRAMRDIEHERTRRRDAEARLAQLQAQPPRVVEKPVEKIVTRTVEKPVEKIVTRTVEKPVEVVKWRERTVEKPVDRIVTRVVERPVEVVKEVPVPDPEKDAELEMLREKLARLSGAARHVRNNTMRDPRAGVGDERNQHQTDAFGPAAETGNLRHGGDP